VIGYRVRRPYIVANPPAGRIFAATATITGIEVIAGIGEYGPAALWFGLIPVGLLLDVLRPVTVLGVMRSGLRFRERITPNTPRGAQGSREVDWRDVREIFVAPHHDTLIVGVDTPGRRYAALIEAPVTALDAIRSVVPHVPVREGSLAEILTWTGQTYVLDPWTPRTRLLVTLAISVLSAAVTVPLLVFAGVSSVMTVTYFCAAATIVVGPRTLALSPHGLRTGLRAGPSPGPPCDRYGSARCVSAATSRCTPAPSGPTGSPGGPTCPIWTSCCVCTRLRRSWPGSDHQRRISPIRSRSQGSAASG
jgi:hypothetical protein